MSDQNIKVAPFPTTVADLVRAKPAKRSLNDMVEEFWRQLYDNVNFRKLVDVAYNEQAIIGNIEANYLIAAQMIQALAKDTKSLVADENLVTIRRSLKWVLKQYGLSPKQRRNTLGGNILSETE